MSWITPSTVLMLLLLAPARASASPASPLAQTVHVVQPGETVWTIAQQHGLHPDRIVSANRLRNPDRLQIGDRLAVPAVASRGASPARRPSAASSQGKTHVGRAGRNPLGRSPQPWDDGGRIGQPEPAVRRRPLAARPENPAPRRGGRNVFLQADYSDRAGSRIPPPDRG